MPFTPIIYNVPSLEARNKLSDLYAGKLVFVAYDPLYPGVPANDPASNPTGQFYRLRPLKECNLVVNGYGKDDTHWVLDTEYNGGNSSSNGTGNQGPADPEHAFLPITMAGLRGSMPAQPQAVYYMVDAGKRGPWRLRAGDNTSVDNTGTLVVSSNGLRFERLFDGPMQLSWFDLIAGNKGEALNNALKLDAVIKAYDYVHLFLNRDDANNADRYYFDKVPGSGAFNPTVEEACINFRDRHITFEAGPSVELVALQGAVGMQNYRTVGDTFLKLKNIRMSSEHGGAGIVGQGKLANGTYSDDWGLYKLNGLNMWGAGSLEDCSFGNFAGHGMCLFGSSSIKLNGPQFPISGTIGRDRQYDNFTPDNPADLPRFQSNVKMVFNNQTFDVGGIQGAGATFRETDANSLPAGTHVVGYAYARGNSLFADHVTTKGFNSFYGNAGCGIFTTSDEANQGIFFGIDVRNNGGWGVCDSSLLGNIWIAPHGTQNGQNFNSLYSNPQILAMGSFTNRGYNQTSSTFIGQYTEQGNQGPDRLGLSTSITGGFDGAGMSGGYGLKSAGLMYNLHSGGRSENEARVEYNGTLDFFLKGQAGRFGINADGKPTWNGVVFPGF